MKRILLLIAFLPFAAAAQLDAAVKEMVRAEVKPLSAKIDSLNSAVEYDTVLVASIGKAGNIDTLTAPGIYQLTVSGSASAVRLLYLSRSASGVVTIRTANPMAWAGAGTWAASVINNRVIISTTATGITYQRQKL